MPFVSVIVPTFREAENLRALIERMDQVRQQHLPELELIVVDDDSRDGIDDVVAEMDRPWVRLIVRRSQRGLSTAVIEGMRAAKGDVLIVMDADLSHPPEKIPEMVARLEKGADFVLGSRYVPGGSTDLRWSAWRRLNSRLATLLARPLTSVRDPMSGFFALRRATFERAARLNPLGYKIALELIVKCHCRHVHEVPIHFAQRLHGESKLSVRQQWLYLRHLGRLLRHRMHTRVKMGGHG